MRDCALMLTLLQALFKRPTPNPCNDAGLAARLDHHTLATCPNNEPQFERVAVLEDQAEVEISLQCFEGTQSPSQAPRGSANRHGKWKATKSRTPDSGSLTPYCPGKWRPGSTPTASKCLHEGPRSSSSISQMLKMSWKGQPNSTGYHQRF